MDIKTFQYYNQKKQIILSESLDFKKNIDKIVYKQDIS